MCVFGKVEQSTKGTEKEQPKQYGEHWKDMVLKNVRKERVQSF